LTENCKLKIFKKLMHIFNFETENLAFFNTRAAEGLCTGIVFNIGSNTVYGRIAFLSSSFD